MRFIVVVTALAITAGLAQGAEDPPSVEARRHFEEGTKLFNLGEFGHAATEYKAAYKAKPDPVFLYNIAQALRLNNDLSGAVFFYRSYLRNTSHPPNEREVERRIRELDEQIAAQKQVTTAPPNEPVPPGTTPPATVEPAAPPPAALPAPATTADTSVTTTAATTTPAQSERTPIYKKWWLWTIVGGVAVVALGVGLGVGLGTHGAAAPTSHFGTVLSF